MNRPEFFATIGVILSGAPGARAVGVAVEAQASPPGTVELGDDVFLRATWRDVGTRGVGLITNQSGVLSRRHHARRRGAAPIRRTGEGAVRPGARPARRPRRRDLTFPRTPMRARGYRYTASTATRAIPARMLDGIDVLVFDIQDVGARPYTYASTLAYVMESARQYGKEIWVLDRPNPIGGVRVEGPVLDPAYKSFIGLYPIPERHGLTIGELAQLFNGHFGIGAKLRVVRITGWSRRNAVGRHEPALDADVAQRAVRPHAAGVSCHRPHRRGRGQQRCRHGSPVRVRRRVRLQRRGVRAHADRARDSRARASSRSNGCRSAAFWWPVRRWPACRSTSTTRTRFPTVRTAVETARRPHVRARPALHVAKVGELRPRLGDRTVAQRLARWFVCRCDRLRLEQGRRRLPQPSREVLAILGSPRDAGKDGLQYGLNFLNAS